MAEVVAELQERILPEYEQMKKFGICTDEEIRDCIRKRQNFQIKITQSEKSIRNYVDFIVFERKINKWIKEKESLHGTALSGLKASISSRIIRLYREGLRKFPQEESFWKSYIQFCKSVVPHEVSSIYEKMLTVHGDKPHVWCHAALWAHEYNLNLPKVKEIFFRALQRHPESEAINKTFFDILLMEAFKMNAQRNLENNSTSEQDFGIERVEIVYKNSKKNIANVGYFLSLLERCEEEKFKNITARLQKSILEDLMILCPREEVLWDSLAQRELRGFNMADLYNLPSTDAGKSDDNAINETKPTTQPEKIEKSVDIQDIKDPFIRSVWQKRTLHRRIELCVDVYKTAVKALQSPLMWTFYINAMLKLNQDMSTQQVLKRKCLAAAFKEGHESGLMSIEHYCAFIQLLTQSVNGIELSESVLKDAIKVHKSLKLYDIWISMYITENNEPKVLSTFRKANEDLGTEHCQSLWRMALQFYKTRYFDCAKTLHTLYREACQQISPDFGVFKAEYLEFCILNMNMEKTRSEYDELCRLPPPCLALHQKMSQIESRLISKNKEDLNRWRLCHENATQFFGTTNTTVWIEYIIFERDHGDPKRMSVLYDRAKRTLQDKLVDNFVSEYTLLGAIA